MDKIKLVKRCEINPPILQSLIAILFYLQYPQYKVIWGIVSFAFCLCYLFSFYAIIATDKVNVIKEINELKKRLDEHENSNN